MEELRKSRFADITKVVAGDEKKATIRIMPPWGGHVFVDFMYMANTVNSTRFLEAGLLVDSEIKD